MTSEFSAPGACADFNHNGVCDADSYGNACDADLKNSGTVSAADFAILRCYLNRNPGPSGIHHQATHLLAVATAITNGRRLEPTRDR